ncbi:lysophospholipid acyltransferase family protein [Thermocrinis sp.]
MIRKLRRELALILLPFISHVLRILGRTIRWQNRYDFEKDRGKIYALWHGNALGLALFGMDRGIVALVSRFRDGDIADGILKRLGFETVRGSTENGKEEKGGRTAILKLMELLKDGKNVAITVDGPKGPAFKVKEGVVFLAKKTGAKIVPACIKFEKCIRLNTWDKLIIPYPFTRGWLFVGKEIEIGKSDDLKEKLKELEGELLRLESLSCGNPG